MRKIAAGFVALAAPGSADGAVPHPRPLPSEVLVVAHRGASALRPEHTLAAYAKAIADGADFIEGADLVPTRDGVLIARHECDIGETTDVAAHPEFADRKRTLEIDGRRETGWFTIDFTLAEIKTLRAKERLPGIRPENTVYDGRFEIPTFAEIIDFVAAEAAARGRPIGLIPELKSTPFLRGVGLPTEEIFLREIAAHAYTREQPLEVQCFHADTLRMLRSRLGRDHANLRLLQLVGPAGAALPAGSDGFGSYDEMMSPAGLARVREYADTIGPETRSIIPLTAEGKLGEETTLVRDARAAGLRVVPYTFRPENRFLAVDFRNGAGEAARNPEGSVAEIQRYIDAGIDGFFTDDPALGRRAVDRTG
ncbi:MAG: glycerophosphodiester phosphodiesterase [Gluconacetobacter diazotrophicus]|nr:glycerophosphodiester phosphodiesterase [Gluconacetobacter diazotrophicus]